MLWTPSELARSLLGAEKKVDLHARKSKGRTKVGEAVGIARAGQVFASIPLENVDSLQKLLRCADRP
jgi:hypothetical protein